MLNYDLMDSLYGKDILVYGLGSVSKALLPRLYAMPEKFRLYGIALTHIEQEKQYQNTGLQIRSTHYWAKECPNATVLIATSDTYHKEIAEVCKGEGFRNIVPVTSALKDFITQTFFEYYLTNKGVNLEGDYIELGNAKFINPLTARWHQNLNVFGQLSDIVFPHLFSDWNLLDEGPYDPDGILELTEGCTVLDCGANLGTFSAYAASKGCKCYAFEPTPELQPVLHKYAELYPGIIPVESAVSNKNGTTALYLSSYSCGANSLLTRVHSTKSIMVPTITIDEFVKSNQIEKVDFIKADIEGAERLMLEGAQETLLKHAPKLSLCTYHLPDDKKVLAELILRANSKYTIQYHWEKLYAYVP